METTVIDGVTYHVTRPQHDMDMNYHFNSGDGDYLVDMMDVMEFTDKEFATVRDAIKLAKHLANEGVQWYWRVR